MVVMQQALSDSKDILEDPSNIVNFLDSEEEIP